MNLREEIRRLQLQLGMTLLFVTHDQDEALSISDRIGVMSDGRIEQLGTPREVYSDPATPFVARYEGVSVECARLGEDYSLGVVTPIRGDAPARPVVPPDAREEEEE